MQRQKPLTKSDPNYWIEKLLGFREAIYKQGIVPLFMSKLRLGLQPSYQEYIQINILPLLNLLNQEEVTNRKKGIKSKNLMTIEDTHINHILRWQIRWRYEQTALSVLELIDIYGHLNSLIENLFSRRGKELITNTVLDLDNLDHIFQTQINNFPELIKNIPPKSDNPADFKALNNSIGLIKKPLEVGMDGLVLQQAEVKESKDGSIPAPQDAAKVLRDDFAFLQKPPVSLRIKNIIAATKTEESRHSLNYQIRKYLLGYISNYKKLENSVGIRGLTETPSESKVSDQDLINNPKLILLQTSFIESQDDLEKLINLIDYIPQVSKEENLQIILKVKKRIDELLLLHKDSEQLDSFKNGLETFIEMTKLYCHAKRFEDFAKKENYDLEVKAPKIPSHEDNVKVLKEWAKVTTLSIESRTQDILAELEHRKREEATKRVRERRKEEALRKKEEELRQQTTALSPAPVAAISAKPVDLNKTKPKKASFFKKHPFITAGIILGVFAAVAVCVFFPPAVVGVAKGVASLVTTGSLAAETAGAIHFAVTGITLFLGGMVLSGLGWLTRKICGCGKSSTKEDPSPVVSPKSSPEIVSSDRTPSRSTADIHQSMGSQPNVTPDIPRENSNLKIFSANFRASRASLRKPLAVPVTAVAENTAVARANP